MEKFIFYKKTLNEAPELKQPYFHAEDEKRMKKLKELDNLYRLHAEGSPLIRSIANNFIYELEEDLELW